MDIILLKQAQKKIKELDRNMKKRIKETIYSIPQGDIKKLQGYNNRYRLRVGDYRILYRIEDNIIIIENVLPRGEAYKNL